MPQMAPMPWLAYSLIFVILIMIINSTLFYMPPLSTPMFFKEKTSMSKSWKW